MSQVGAVSREWTHLGRGDSIAVSLEPFLERERSSWGRHWRLPDAPGLEMETECLTSCSCKFDKQPDLGPACIPN